MRIVKRPQTTRVYLNAWDPSGETWVDIRAPRFAETAQRQTYWSQVQVFTTPMAERAIYQQTEAELAAIEIYLTFVDSNILIEDEDGEPVLAFRPGLVWSEFIQTLNGLEDELVLEWHAAVLELKPDWKEV
jgi:hypothetical protein